MAERFIKLVTSVIALNAGSFFPVELVALEHEQIEIAKAATVFVKTGTGTGTAFCVDSSKGFFLTNYHVVEDLEVPVTLIANPGMASKESAIASVLLADPDNDLALLQATFRSEIPSLSLGIGAKIKETDVLTAFGYPFGSALAADGVSPAVTVSLGRVTSLRKKGGILSSIQTDASVNHGNSGGPMLNENGEVIGVVRSGISAAGMNFAIPPEVFVSFLKKPVVFTNVGEAGLVDFTNVNTFTVRITTVLPTAEKYTLEIFLNSTKLELTETQEDVYQVVLPELPENILSGKEPHLKLITRLRGNVVSELAGKIRGVHSKKFPGPVFTTVATLPSTKNSPVKSAFPSPSRSNLHPILSLSPNQLLADEKTINFEESFSQVCPGGHGRYLVFYFASSRKIQVFDLANLEMLGAPLEVGTGDLLVAAGADRILALDTFENRVYSIRFDTLAVEKSSPLPWSGTPFQIEMGRSCSEMAAISYKTSQFSELPHMRPYFLEVPSLEPLDIKFEAKAELEELRIRSSANGKVMTFTNSDCVGTTAIVSSGKLFYQRNTIRDRGWKIPSLDGTHLLKCCGAIQTLFGQNLAFYPAPRTWLFHHLPSGHPAFYVRVGSKEYDNEAGHEISLVPNGELRPIHDLKGRFSDLDDISKHDFKLDRFDWNDGDLSFDRRIHLIPQLQILATLPATNDRMVLRPFPFENKPEADAPEALYVNSIPPASAISGNTYTYKVKYHSTSDIIDFEKVIGPKDLNISNDGEVEWTPNMTDAGRTHQVVLRLVDQHSYSRFHSFPIYVEKGKK